MLHVGDGARSGARQTDVERVDAELLHQVQDAQLLLDGRIFDRGRLQAVAQRFVVEQDLARRTEAGVVQRVPVVDEFGMPRHCDYLDVAGGLAGALAGGTGPGLPSASAFFASGFTPVAAVVFSRLSFGGSVSPNTDILPRPATLRPVGSSGLGK